jgi:hypothetical protein
MSRNPVGLLASKAVTLGKQLFRWLTDRTVCRVDRFLCLPAFPA